MNLTAKAKIIICAISAIVLAAAAFLLIYNGIIILNSPSKDEYPVRGVDVSHYQGAIDWDLLTSHDIDFAFIKATEGAKYVDDRFEYNYENSQKSGIAVGAYHFFSYDSPGLLQAENFINTVKPFEGMLPPVIDLEFYGDKQRNLPESKDVNEQLDILLAELEKHYGLKPVIYATHKSYSLYLSDRYNEYDIWIRSVFTKPVLCDKRSWTFWQYTDKEKLSGYNGEESFIDMNVFNGSLKQFKEYPRYYR